MKLPPALPSLVFSLLLPLAASAQQPGRGKAAYPAWKHSGVMAILTTPDGANLPGGAAVEQFPLLVRLHRDWFDFSQAADGGADIRFSSEAGEPLKYEIEDWDKEGGTATLWVRVPRIAGNAQQALRMHWGKEDAAGESDGKAVFNESNGYVAVLHMADGTKDATGTLQPKDTGTAPAAGIAGGARRFPGNQGIYGGDRIGHFPTGSEESTTQVWMRAEKPNGTPVGWGEQKQQGKVVMQFASPPHINMDCWFSDAGVTGRTPVPMGEWKHVVHTYRRGEATIYVDGALDTASKTNGTPVNIPRPARLTVGGWPGRFDFTGEIDEVRVSKVTRPAEWVRLEYENQKPHNTLVGPLVQPGTSFAVSHEKMTVDEGKSFTFQARAGGARKLYWILVKDGREEVVASDRFAYTFEAGRVAEDTVVTLRLKAVFADGAKTRDIPVKIRQTIPQPEFSFAAPEKWDGRRALEIVPEITNLAAMKAAGAGEVKVDWSVGPMAVSKEISGEKLILRRAEKNGTLTLTARIRNGGAPVTLSRTVEVTQPPKDPWVERVPDKDEKPEEGQFYARDESNRGTLHYNGTLAEAADSVFLKLYADDTLADTVTAKPGADRSYALSVKLKPGLIRYRIEFGTVKGGVETVSDRIGDLVCGDAFLIEGQSNALATDTREESPPETHEWIRSYGNPSPKPEENTGNLWCRPVWKARKGEKAELGWWGMELAKNLVATHQVPVFIINGAVGGTRIDEHQRNAANPADPATIYGRMLWRVQRAKMTHGLRAVIWHQGESDQGAAGPTGGFGWESYQPLFVEMAAGWKQDFPNLGRYYIFQIWPDACSMGGRDGNGDRLREKQRTLPQLFSNMDILSTHGIRPPGGCHYPLTGWAEFARMLQPLIERDFHGKKPAAPLTPPNLVRARFAPGAKDAIALEFDQPVVWSDALAGQFYLDGEKDQVASGSVNGNLLTLKLKAPSAAKTVTYLKEVSWSQDTLLPGANGMAALTFCEVPVAD